MNEEELLVRWQDAAKALATFKAEELNLRNQILALATTKKEGSETVIFGGVKLAIQSVLNYNIDKGELEVIYDKLNDEEKAAIRFKPELVLANYRKLPVNSTLRLCVTVKPGQGQLKQK